VIIAVYIYIICLLDMWYSVWCQKTQLELLSVRTKDRECFCISSYRCIAFLL
jgi:hypothetical protein